MRSYERSDGTLGAVKDHSYLEFLIEALIAQSAVALAVYPSSSFYDDLNHLPTSLRSVSGKSTSTRRHMRRPVPSSPRSSPSWV